MLVMTGNVVWNCWFPRFETADRARAMSTSHTKRALHDVLGVRPYAGGMGHACGVTQLRCNAMVATAVIGITEAPRRAVCTADCRRPQAPSGPAP